MRQDPLTDAFSFLTTSHNGYWATPVFWLLLLGSAAAAVFAWRADPMQRSVRHIGIGAAPRHHRRNVVAAVALEDPASLRLGIDPLDAGMVEHASTQLQSALVRDIVLPNIAVFGPLVYAIEVAIAVSLILGLATRLGSVLGALMAINLWLGLYNADGEWPGLTCSWSSWNSCS